MKKKVLFTIIALAVCMSLFCACNNTIVPENRPVDSEKTYEQTDGDKDSETEVNMTAFPKPSRSSRDVLDRFTAPFKAELKNAYSSIYPTSDFSFANYYGSYSDKDISRNSYIFLVKIGEESSDVAEETASEIVFRYRSGYKLSVYEAKSKTICDMSKACEKSLLTASDVKNIKHKCDMEDFAAGEGLPLLETYRKFVGVENKVALGEMEILDYFGVYHGVHVAVIDDHYGVHATNYPQYDISGYWFYGIRESMFVAYKDGEMKYMCAPAEKGWYVANEWLTKEDIAAINEKHLKHLEYDYE